MISIPPPPVADAIRDGIAIEGKTEGVLRTDHIDIHRRISPVAIARPEPTVRLTVRGPIVSMVGVIRDPNVRCLPRPTVRSDQAFQEGVCLRIVPDV